MENLLFDELGRTMAVTSDESSKHRIRGKECIKANIEIVRSIASLLSTSLGPNGMDKVLQSPDDDITVTNDGATILQCMEMTENPVSKLIVDLSKAQDDEIGDGTTSVVVLAGALLTEASKLLERGMHPIRIAAGFEKAFRLAKSHLSSISEDISGTDILRQAARTSLGSKIVAKALDHFSSLCTEAVLAVADQERGDVDFELIKIESKIGRDISDTKLIHGVVLSKEFSHPQMQRSIEDAHIAVLACPFEPPKLKTKHDLKISNVEEYEKLDGYEKEKFEEMITCVKQSGANLVICQWGFDDEANSMLMEHSLPAIRWVGGAELEQVAVHTGAQIISRFIDLKKEDLGHASVHEEPLGTEDDHIIVVENGVGKTVTILVRGGNNMAIEEAKRSIHDALCAVRNLIKNKRIVYGGGSNEISCSIFLEKQAGMLKGEERECVLGFGKALEEIPLCLAKNSGYSGVGYISEIRRKQIEENNHFIGVDCFENGKTNMKECGVFDTLNGKIHQLAMATQLVTMILKIDDVIIGENQ
ncbi:T-complex protein 1 subunit epsilon [Astathelohania contejeani]|uniref:T-complex protein 1 subunit epsilon n=1 Tax=Astathelohania contejeani TaxID=164912 RepID=A0ABQ7I225_9MICR|nr:T-complex protein 1 subunit epsilon [Thelohania contejeani]